jgi:hypothetical protein
VLSVTLSVGLQTTSQLAILPLDTLQEREMEVAVMELTDNNTCPGAGISVISNMVASLKRYSDVATMDMV